MVKIKHSVSAGGVVLNRESQVLVVNQNGDSWSLPKGHFEPGETLVEAAKREITEESGIDQLELVRELGSFERYRIGPGGKDEDKTELKKIVMFLFRTDQEKLGPFENETTEARWVDKERVADLLTHQKDKEFFQKILI